MNTMVPEKDIPSHQGPDAKSVDPELRCYRIRSKSSRDIEPYALLEREVKEASHERRSA
ncbi:MAG: hypothetical protein R2783_02600 [Gelidibacter sp.]